MGGDFSRKFMGASVRTYLRGLRQVADLFKRLIQVADPLLPQDRMTHPLIVNPAWLNARNDQVQVLKPRVLKIGFPMFCFAFSMDLNLVACLWT